MRSKPLTSVVIYGTPGCSQCDRAKKLCQTNGIEFEYKNAPIKKIRKLCPIYISGLPQVFTSSGSYVGGIQVFEKRILGEL